MRVNEDPLAEEPTERSAESPAVSPEPSETLPLVLVRWHDAWFDPEQQTPDEWRGDYLVHTVGFLVRRDSRVVSVAQELLPDGDGYRAVTHIPLSVIESIDPLFRSV